MNKKGQFYLIAVLVIIAIISILTAKLNFVSTSEEPASFSELSENFEVEAIKIIDKGIAEGKTTREIQSELENFARTYASYSSLKSKQFGFLYVFGEGENVQVANFLVEDANVRTDTFEKQLSGGNALLLNRITLEVAGEKFVRDLSIRASTFRGINLISGRGKIVEINIGGIPYTVAISGGISFSSLELECRDSKVGRGEIKEKDCFVKVNGIEAEEKGDKQRKKKR